MAYIDNNTIFGQTLEEHVNHFYKVFQRLKEAGLTIKVNKCQFGLPEMTYLGHRVCGHARIEIQSKSGLPE